MMALSFVGIGVTLSLSGLLPPSGFAAFVVLSALMGFTGALGTPSYVSLVQAAAPPESLGRVFALMTAVMSLATPVGLFVAGPVAEAVGVATWFLLSGVFILVTGIWTFLRSRSIRA